MEYYFHSFLLRYFIINKLKYPTNQIIPELKNISQFSNTFEDYDLLKINDQNVPKQSIHNYNKIFQSDEYFMLVNFQITHINTTYENLHNFVNDINNNDKTLNFIFQKIYKIFRNQFDDINIDKLVYIYINYFKKRHDIIVTYYKIFTIIKNTVDDKNIKSSLIHDNIIQEILHSK